MADQLLSTLFEGIFYLFDKGLLLSTFMTIVVNVIHLIYVFSYHRNFYLSGGSSGNGIAYDFKKETLMTEWMHMELGNCKW